jgi:hypothetical protein
MTHTQPETDRQGQKNDKTEDCGGIHRGIASGLKRIPMEAIMARRHAIKIAHFQWMLVSCLFSHEGNA